MDTLPLNRIPLKVTHHITLIPSMDSSIPCSPTDKYGDLMVPVEEDVTVDSVRTGLFWMPIHGRDSSLWHR